MSDLAWLEGIWQGKIGGREFEARCSGADGGQVLSASKYTKDGAAAPAHLPKGADNKLTILVSGPGEDGKEQVLTYSLTKK